MSNYAKLLKDPRWQKKRLRILERDNWTCQDTGKQEETLQVHHCWYAKGPPWETPDEFLLTLCESAHEERQELESDLKMEFGRMLSLMNCVDLSFFGAQFIEAVKCLKKHKAMPFILSEYDYDKIIKEGRA